ncbi:MAG: choice-of-anchor B family protein, partial [Phycisphaerae bacterium]|nr:choice-of-anchor B family protein [Phycisphaerae bacterium]
MTNIRNLAIAALTAVLCTFATAHVDDYKARDLLPPVYGPTFHESEGGTAGTTFPSEGVQLKSWLPLNAFAGSPTSGNDCWGYVHPTSQREYAIIGLSNGTAFVEVTNPANAQIVGMITGPTSLWRCVKVFKHFCYVGSEGGGGVQAIDMSNIDGQIVGQPRVQLASSITTGGGASTHTLFIDTKSGFLYRCGGGSNGLRIYDLNASFTNP